MSRTGVDTGVAERPQAPKATARRPARPKPPLSREVVETRVLGVLKWITIAFFVIATLFPFYYMVELSIRSIEDVALDPGALWPPRGASLSAYGEVLRSVQDGGQGFLVFLRNSGIIALSSVVITLAVSILGAYSIARLQFFGRRQVHFLFLAVYLFPAILLAIPLFVFFTRIGLRGSLFGLVLVYVSQIVAVSIYMLRNYFDTIPASLEEAAAGLRGYRVARALGSAPRCSGPAWPAGERDRGAQRGDSVGRLAPRRMRHLGGPARGSRRIGRRWRRWCRGWWGNGVCGTG